LGIRDSTPAATVRSRFGSKHARHRAS
jgi:hypothetical protein